MLNTYLLINSGPRAGSRFFLQADRENTIGRGLECSVVLTDPRCSRIHARIIRESGQWFVYDEESRNGTLVNGQKTTEAQLIDGTELRVGSTSFIFYRPVKEETWKETTAKRQTLIVDEAIVAEDTGHFILDELNRSDLGENFFVLFQLSFRLLSVDDPLEVVRISVELLYERTGATIAGFLWLADDGQLRPQMIFPAGTHELKGLDESLTELVFRKQHAIRVENQSCKGESQDDSEFSDSIYVPLVEAHTTVGAIHLYRDKGQFKNSDYQIARSLANILVRALVRARKEASLKAENRRLVATTADTDELVGESDPMQKLKNKIGKVAQASGCVLVRGESGSGKELVARALHKASPRADRPMLSVNCAAIPSHLMESQLFGHKKGAFTGAESDHIGWFEQSDLGTLFLDEIGELTLDGQAKLLRILEGHPFLPVGATQEVAVDVRIIAATNRDLREYVEEKKFREDLYFRLSVFELQIPALRERDGDIQLLVDHFFNHFRQNHGRTSLELSTSARDCLISYSWPGNVRQLRNVIDSAIVMAEEPEVLVEDLGLRAPVKSALQSLRIDEWERKLITEALSRTENRVPDAAKLLGISRATLYRKIDEYGIER